MAKFTDEEIKSRISEEIAKRGTTMYAVCQQAGVNRTILSNYMTGRTTSMGSESLYKILNVLGIELNDN